MLQLYGEGGESREESTTIKPAVMDGSTGIQSALGQSPDLRFACLQGDATSSKIPKPRKSRPSAEDPVSPIASGASAQLAETPQASAGSPPPAEEAGSDPAAGRKSENPAHGSATRPPSSSRAIGGNGLASGFEGEASFVSRESSLGSRSEGGKMEPRLAGWKEKRSRSHGGPRDHGEVVEKKGPEGEGAGAGKTFAGRMNNMLNAATHSLRPSSAKKEQSPSSRCVVLLGLVSS